VRALWVVALLMLAVMPSTVLADGNVATPAAGVAPVLTAPANAVGGFVEGGSMTFEWRGALLGDSDAIGRSFFRVEIAAVSDVPAGAQSTWTKVERAEQTEPGTTETTLTMGVPAAGTYKWRVCAWGVVDDIAANEIQQMPGGCGAARSFSAIATVVNKAVPGELAQTTTRTEVAPPRIIEERRPATATTPEATDPVAADPAEPVEEVVEQGGAATFTKLISTSRRPGYQGSAVEGLGPKTITSTTASGRRKKGFGSAIASGLGATLPLIPIPYWTLGLLLVCFPLARLWRRNVLEMFEWTDGSVDGSGGEFDYMLTEIADRPLTHNVKTDSMTADSEETAPPRPDVVGGRIAA